MERGLRDRLHGFTRWASMRCAITVIAAAIVLVIAGGAVLIAVQPGQPQTSPSARASSSFDFETAGWGWRPVGEPAPGLVARIANGYLGECVANGLPAACTSKDGVTWTLPADPDIRAALQACR